MSKEQKEQITAAARWTALTVLPALTTAWLALGTIWGLPLVQPIGATLTCIDAFLGTILGVTAQELSKAQSAAAESTTVSLEAEVAALKAQVAALAGKTASTDNGGTL